MIAGNGTRIALRSAQDRILVYAGDASYTGSQLDRAVDVLAHDIHERTGGTGEIGLWGWNSAELLVAHLAIERAGLTRVPVDPAAPHTEAVRLFDKTDVDLVLVGPQHHLDIGRPTMELTPDIWSRESAPYAPRTISGVGVALRIIRGVIGEELLAIPLSFDNWEAHMALSERLFRDGTFGQAPGPDACYLTVQQMQYGTGLLGTFPFLRMGLPQVVLDKFDAQRVVEAVNKHAITASFMVPAMVTRIVDALGSDKPDWNLNILCGGAPFEFQDLISCLEVLPQIAQLYGRFEGGWPLTVLSQKDHALIVHGDHSLARSVGRAVDGIELDPRPVAGSNEAELWVRSACVSRPFSDPDGWCALGDLVTVDDAGYYYLHGRLDGMINSGSFHIYPQEVVAAIRAEFPTVKDVHVEGKPDDRWGEAVSALLTWNGDVTPPSDLEFRDRMGRRLAKYKVPTLIDHRTERAPKAQLGN